jgi:PAS domain S-box-containing protein
MVTSIAVILTDAERKIIWVNQDFTDITGYTLLEVVGKRPSLLQGSKSEQTIINRIRRGLEAMVPLKEEITNYRKNGEAYLCKLVVYPVFNEKEELIHFIAFEVDGNIVKDDSNIPLLNLQEKYQTSSLKGIEEVKLFGRLQEMLSKDKIYLNAEVSLRAVADGLKTNTKYLSQVINHRAGCNFQHFLNIYRVEEAKAKIIDPQYKNLTLFGIALQCGFKNKSTFYKVFKDITGITPKDFIKQKNLIREA